MLVVGLGHFNRIAISVAGAERIIPENGIDSLRMGQVYSAFLLIYMLAMVPAGWLIDRWGARATLVVLSFDRPSSSPGRAPSDSISQKPLLSLLDRTDCGPFFDGTRQRAIASGGCPHGFRSRPQQSQIIGQRFGDLRPAMRASRRRIMVSERLIDPLRLALRLLRDSMDYAGRGAVCWTWGTRALPPLVETQGRLETPTGHGRRLPDPQASRPNTQDVLLRVGVICLTLSYAALGYFQYMFFYWIQYYIGTVRHLGNDVSRQYSTFITLTMGIGMIFGGNGLF